MKELKKYFDVKAAESSKDISEGMGAKMDRLAKQMQEIRDEVEGLAEDVDAVRSPVGASQTKKEDEK
jgi:outer membrane murein-binding lipoprotein Lpp